MQNKDVYGPALEKVLGDEVASEVMEKVGSHILGTCSGIDLTDVFKGASPEAKKALLNNTDRCLAEGAFGLPWFVGMFIRFTIELNLYHIDQGLGC